MSTTDTPPQVAMTLVLPLRARDTISLADFYDYWLNAHVTLPARSPGIHDIWLHQTSFDASLWPVVPGTSSRPEPEDDIHGIPEATFPTLHDVELFQQHSGLQMEDGLNFLAEQIAYRSAGPSTATVVDRTGVPVPDGHDTLVRHIVFLRRRPGSSVQQLRDLVTGTLVPACAASEDVLKVRRHLFEEVEVTLDHPGVRMSKPLERQYQAAVEVVVRDEAALARFAASPGWRSAADALAEHCGAVHAARVLRCITTKAQGRITLAGVRGAAAADVITRLEAENQRQPEVSALFLPLAEPAGTPGHGSEGRPARARVLDQRDP